MFTAGAMLAAGETMPVSTFPNSFTFTVPLGMKDIPTWPSFRNKRFAFGESMFFYSNTSNNVSVRDNYSGTILANISDVSLDNIDQVAAATDGSRMVVAEHVPGGTGDDIHIFRDDTSDWTSYTKEQSLTINSPWNTIWNDIVSGVQCNDICDRVAISGAMGLSIYNRSGTSWSFTETVDFSAWPDATYDYSILANNNISADRIVLAVDTNGDQVFNYIIVMKLTGSVWSHEFTQSITSIEDGNLSVNNDCTEIVWSDSINTKSITRSGTSWSAGLSISSGTNTFHASSIAPDGGMMVCNVNDVAQLYFNDAGSWSLDDTEAWNAYLGMIIPFEAGDKIDIGWSVNSTQLLLIPDDVSASPNDVAITIVGRSVV